MFCKNCGKESDSTKKFCINCGTAFSNPQNANTKTQPSERRIMPTEPWTTEKSLKILAVIIIVGVIIFYRVQNAADSTAIDKNNSALDAYDSGNNTQAISQFEDASLNAVTTDTKINTLKNLAYAYDGDGQKEKALSTFQEALKLTTKNSFEYYLIYGEIAEYQNNPDLAFVNYKKAFQLEPDDFQINNALALFSMDLEGKHPQFEDYKNALIYAQKAYNVSKLEIAKQNLGLAYYYNEKYDLAISTFSTVTLDKDKSTAYWLGLSYAANDDVPNAKFYLQKSIDNGFEVPQEVYDYLNSY